MSFAAKAARLVLVMLREGSRGPRLLEKKAAMLRHVELSKQAEKSPAARYVTLKAASQLADGLRQLADKVSFPATRRPPPCIARLQYRNVRAPRLDPTGVPGRLTWLISWRYLYILSLASAMMGRLVWRRLRQDSRR